MKSFLIADGRMGSSNTYLVWSVAVGFPTLLDRFDITVTNYLSITCIFLNVLGSRDSDVS